MGGEKGGGAREVLVELGLKREPGASGERRREGDSKIFEQRDKGGPVGQGPVR